MNPVIKCVLDNILAVTEIDPAAIEPDAPLGRDFEVSPEKIREIISRSARALHIEISVSERMTEATPRQMVEILQASQSTRPVSAAA